MILIALAALIAAAMKAFTANSQNNPVGHATAVRTVRHHVGIVQSFVSAISGILNALTGMATLSSTPVSPTGRTFGSSVGQGATLTL